MDGFAAISETSPLAGVTIVDADTHITEWPDLWTSRAPASLKDRVPQIKEVDGRAVWVIDGDKVVYDRANAGSAIHRDGTKGVYPDFRDWSFADVIPSAYSVKHRLAYLDQVGIRAQIGYPNVLGFGGQNAMKVDPGLRVASTRIYNDAMAELQHESGERIFPMLLLPWWDVKEAVAEIHRGHAMGFRGVNTGSDPQDHGLPELGAPHWNPIWEACVEHDLPVNFHIGASDTSLSWVGSGMWPTFNDAQRMVYGSTMIFFSNARVLTNIILSGFLDRFPTLKIVSVESGVGFLPFLLEALKYQMAEARIRPSLTPAELFKRQIYACSWFEHDNLRDSALALGVDNIMFETDYPHPTCLYPGALQHMEKVAETLQPAERTKIFGGNAARVYNLPI